MSMKFRLGDCFLTGCRDYITIATELAISPLDGQNKTKGVYKNHGF